MCGFLNLEDEFINPLGLFEIYQPDTQIITPNQLT